VVQVRIHSTCKGKPEFYSHIENTIREGWVILRVVKHYRLMDTFIAYPKAESIM